jgi:putative Mn2+ efflux pump MntP
MYFVEILLLAVGLSMDSLAVSTAGGVVLRNYRPYCMLKIASVMALFQVGMTLIGFLLGDTFAEYIHDYDHWIAFALLVYLGGRMMYEGYYEKEKDDKPFDPMRNKTLCGMGLATSIDALAVGISLALLHSPILTPLIVIGLVTFILSAFGVYFGSRFGGETRINLNIAGGLILVGIGCKILIEHLFL